MPRNTWIAVIALLLINSAGGFGYFLFSLPERSEWRSLITGTICGIVVVLLIVNYRRTYPSRVSRRERASN
jgi:protein-S-isoprenylcysteine O-methyltransferase Ste14